MEAFVRLLQNFWLSLQSGQLSHLGMWNYLLLALIVAIEGPIATLLGAVAASTGYFKPNLVFLAACIGNLSADFAWYLVGYAGKVEWALRFGHRFGLRQEHLDQLEKGMKDHAPKLLVVAKLTAAFTIPTLIAAGLAKAPIKRWLPLYLLAEAVWTGSLVLIGYHTTIAITRVEHGVQNLVIASGACFVVFSILLMRRVLQNPFRTPITNHNRHP